MKLRTLGVAVLGAVGLATVPACQKQEAPPAAPVAQAPAPAPAPKVEAPAPVPAAPVTGGGTVQGTVAFKGAVPAPAAVKPSDDPACDGMALKNQSLLVTDSKLANALVRVRGLVPHSHPTQPALIDQQKCTYTPRVQGVTAGQQVFIKNSDGTLHNARALNGTKTVFNVAQPPNAKAVPRPLPADAEVIRLKCDIHPWMAAWVVVNPNPYFATSGTDGAFSIEHLPAGTYTLEAWHETLGTKTAEVTVKEGETVTASFVFSAEDAKGTASGGVK
ncbi:carboxypeptidase regulatory-like domain-containing protein [Archangium violaceum]|uniref:carboxypeptidase regulatory-like domain-containing protein n=1 Tax=Archangium violaceum TaxID=83451 RepID=UPI002B2BEC28|nr:carboxypeptidase regulatory-like domain-containing protein [Archangium gephyra]